MYLGFADRPRTEVTLTLARSSEHHGIEDSESITGLFVIT